MEGEKLAAQIQTKRKKWRRVGLGLLVALLLTLTLALTVGAVKIEPRALGALFAKKLGGKARVDPAVEAILWQLRMPRALLAALVGAALAGSGVALQGLFQNSLVDPYVLGLSSGAALGAALGVSLKLSWLIPPFAFLGALLATFLAYTLAQQDGRVPVMRLLLAGVATSSFLSALVSFLMLSNQENLQTIFFWLMGSFAGRSWLELRSILPYLLVGLGIIFTQLRSLNLLLLGEEAAGQLGLEVEQGKRWLLLGATLAAASSVAACGTIGFVGLVVPHVVRLLTGSDHRLLFPLSLLTGAIFLLLADTLSRTILAPAELPVGIITSLVGAPFFLYLLRRGGSSWQ